MAPEATQALESEIRHCRVCRDAPDGPQLPHAPRPVVHLSPTARICIAGQAPGTRVHASGLPFDDASGKRLRSWMGIGEATFYDRSLVAIAPMGFCFPGQDRHGGDLPPRRECAPLWRDRVMQAMPQLDLVLAIGMYAQKWHLGSRRRRTLTETVADWETLLADPARPRILPLPHPSWRNTAWLARNSWFEQQVVPALRREVARCVASLPKDTGSGQVSATNSREG